jgi:hypothetical protein
MTTTRIADNGQSLVHEYTSSAIKAGYQYSCRKARIPYETRTCLGERSSSNSAPSRQTSSTDTRNPHQPTLSPRTQSRRTYLLEIRLDKLASQRNKPVVAHRLNLHLQQLPQILRKSIHKLLLQGCGVAQGGRGRRDRDSKVRA